jgi:hypothetical protein
MAGRDGERRLEVSGPEGSSEDLLMAAWGRRGEAGIGNTTGHFNGKIEAPRLFARALTPHEAEGLRRDVPARALGSDLVSAWDFARGIASARISDLAGAGYDGVAVNLPMRASVGGPNALFAAALPRRPGHNPYHPDAWLRGRARKAAPSSLPELPSMICPGRAGTRFVLSSLAVRRPVVRVRYEVEEAGGPSFKKLLSGL